VLLISGWTVAAGLQPGSFNPVAGTISTLAADGAAGRWVMTLAFSAIRDGGSDHQLCGHRS
jgi:hypothetical protein